MDVLNPTNYDSAALWLSHTVLLILSIFLRRREKATNSDILIADLDDIAKKTISLDSRKFRTLPTKSAVPFHGSTHRFAANHSKLLCNL